MVPVDLTKADCPEQLSGIAGTIEIGASLDPALLGSTTPTKLLEGALWVRLVPSTGEGDVINVPVVETIIGRPLPLRYTVTGVDPGLWHVTAYLDRDEDTNFSPCNIVSGGLDAVSGRVESVRARLDEIIESDRILLNLLECGQNELSAVRGQMAVHQEEGPVGSGRPVILEVKRTGEPSEPQYVTLFENHTYIEGSGGTFIKQLSPGQYSGKFFVDTTRDSIYTECLETRFGDRYLSESFEFELGSDNITDLGQFVLSPNACPPFEQPIRLEIIPDESLQMLPPRQLSIRVRESGGWSETTRLGDWEEDDGAWIPEFRPLPPGQYQFTVYTDEDENGEYSPCPDRGGDRFTAEFALEVRADRGPPAARFPLTDGCPQ